jgi:outer membrane protein assembly factor BamD
MKKIGLVVVVCSLLLSGCGLFDTKEEGSAQELAWEGMDAFNEGNYKSAIASFEKLKDWYPFSKFSILAELKIPDAHYKLGQYEEAVAGYEEFESLHPRNEAITYVIFQIGQS